MSNRLAALAAVLVLVLVAAAPALAQDEAPACELYDACLDTSEEQEATADQYTESPEPTQPLPETPASKVECEGDSTNPCSPDQGVTQSDNARYAAGVSEAAFDAPASCGSCGLQVAQGALDAITGDGFGDSDSADAFGAALQAARDVAATREAAASEEAGSPEEDTAVYRAAFEAAKEAGADDETAKEAAEQAVAEANSGRAAKGKDRKERAGEDKAREDTANDEEDVAASDEEDGGNDSPGSGDGDAATTPVESSAPLLFGGVAFLSVGGFAALRFARSWSSSDLRRLPRN
ncbi:MAG: hypothetical protein LC781_14225 [Actinobacteria bacterium]|nr:hypothetical protein [Actinomycetota bacterium]